MARPLRGPMPGSTRLVVDRQHSPSSGWLAEEVVQVAGVEQAGLDERERDHPLQLRPEPVEGGGGGHHPDLVPDRGPGLQLRPVHGGERRAVV